MGYLSCKAQSSIDVTNPHNSSTNLHKQKYPNKNSHETHIRIKEFKYNDLEIATNSFSEQKLLGRGSHGLVYKAVLSNGHLVAVKKPSTKQQQPKTCDEFDNEFHILSNLQSSRFVNLVGFTSNYDENSRNDRLLVVEFMCNGTLYDVLHKNSKVPNWGRRIKLALQTAKAVEILHSQCPPVIHRDIKSANVLLDRNHNAKLGDFGLALRCNLDDFRLRSTPPAGTIGYLDPGYVTPDNLSTKTDVFSFGILLLEIISGRKAIDIDHSPPSVIDWAIPLVRQGKLLAIFDPRILPPKDPMVRKQLAVIAAKCVRSNRERRPSMKEVVEALDRLSKLVPLHSWNGLTNPCLMVENVGQPVGLPNGHINTRFKGLECGNFSDVDGKFAKPSKNPRRVYSDLGFRNNLLDLMAEPDVDSENEGEDMIEHKQQSSSSIYRFGSERYNDRGRTSLARVNDGVNLTQLRRSMLDSRRLQTDK
ncbi:serine/threonine-protein kinase-like protein At3g51990 [Amaranthus tricolor]|uniref:serine/threonine-protein kinase-like protein At3g51990 n=1 Tax=Amaranthus tricolor TaxID=29722 RepID=UPI002586B953|nr:serine/threonine-protein kinase-like protein At3g51990 [Amaranthus tricolor]